MAVELSDLQVLRPGAGAPVTLVDRVSFTVPDGSSLGIIGESGSGKSLTLKAMLGLLPRGIEAVGGRVRVGEEELTLPTDPRRHAGFARRAGLGMVFQDPSTALDPLLTVGTQLREVHRYHHPRPRPRTDPVAELLAAVELDAGLADRHPHTLSGGQRQRVVIALALAAGPRVLLCDEPTTALDVTVQATILALLARLRAERGLTLIFVSHDLAVVSRVADHALVLQHGVVVARGTIAEIVGSPPAGYAQMLVETARDTERALHELRGARR
ncbi:MAG TPA: dipeptide/oligopeptide/nickel ABC transporter ATP-binding protein [Cellulomonas sp.]